MCERVSLCAFQGGGQAFPLGLGVESLLWHSLSLLVFLFLELGNTISSLFGGGSTPDTKENGTDTVQVRPGWSQGSMEDGAWDQAAAAETGGWGVDPSFSGCDRPRLLLACGEGNGNPL